MACKKMLVVSAAALAVAFLPALAVATDHVVGDENGWVLNFDYAAWAETRQFAVGDTLVFNYASPSHTVVEVGGADFNACTKPETASVWRSGGDRVELDKPGRRWFFCGVGEHCRNNMKVKITVVDSATAAPAPGAPSTPMPPPASSPAGKVQARVPGAVVVVAVTALAAAVLAF